MSPKRQPKSTIRSATVTIPELEQSKTAVLNTLASEHSLRSYESGVSPVSDDLPRSPTSSGS
jgi:hypothetical protein